MANVFAFRGSFKGSNRLPQRGCAARTLLESLERRRLLSGDGLKGDYFADLNLGGEPFVRVDETVDFDWQYGSPGAAMPADRFSVRWTGQIEPEFSEVYTFYTSTDDGVRLWVNDVLLIDDWNNQPLTTNRGTIALEAGERYDIRKEYYEDSGQAVATLAWSSASRPKEAVPRERLYSGTEVTPTSGVGSVTAFTLIDAASGKAVRTIRDGDVLDLAVLPPDLNIRADVAGGEVGSVRFDLDDAVHRIESGAPFLLAGNVGSRIYSWAPELGGHRLKATPFGKSDGAGEAGTALAIDFTVVVGQTPTPAAPSGLIALSATYQAVALSWDASSGDDSHYIIERSEDGSIYLPLGTADANNPRFTDEQVEGGRRYWYRVAKVNATGTSPYTKPLIVTTAPDPNPVAPIAVTSLTLVNADNASAIMTVADGAVLDLWSLPTRNLNIRANVAGAVGSVRFMLNGAMLRTESSAPYALAGDAGPSSYNSWTPSLGVHTLTADSFTLAGGLGAKGTGTTVRFTVTESAPPIPPAAPIKLSASAVSTSKINLSWTDQSDNETGFRIERSPDGVNFAQIASVGANVMSYGSTGLGAGTKYYYRVRAYNAVGNSPYTAVASATTRTPTPPPTSFPNATNTGPSNRAILVERGSFNVTQEGAVIENFIVRDAGQIIISANNVTLRNFVIENPQTDGAAIKIANGDITGAVIEDGEIFGGRASNGVSGSNYTARRLHIYNMLADAFRVRVNVVIEGCYVHDISLGEDAHGDGVQMYPTDGGNIVIRNNSFDARDANSALFQVDGGWLVENNYFNGGNYTIYCTGQIENIFRNNTFGRDAQYGPVRVGAGDRDLMTWEGNIWADTKTPVLL
jgi:hypothetical protein